jgi:hypothetical protein
MQKLDKSSHQEKLSASWTLPSAATLGSSVRAKGILLEIRARLPAQSRKALSIDGRVLTMEMAGTSEEEFSNASAIVVDALHGIEILAVIPREIQDILTITATERHRWLADGRLPSAGTRTVRLNGRARRITFHVFDPKVVVDVLDRGLVDEWRVQDAEAKAENRRRAAWRAKVTRSAKKQAEASPRDAFDENEQTDLKGWNEFVRDGFLR